MREEKFEPGKDGTNVFFDVIEPSKDRGRRTK